MRVRQIPDVEFVRDCLFIQDAIEVLVPGKTLIVPSSGEHKPVATEAIEKTRIGEARKIVRGQMEVAILVVIAVEEAG